MAKFKTPQFEILAATINRVSTHLNTNMREHSLPLIISNQVINVFVSELCKEFECDNHLFNETLFRAQCGKWVDKQRAKLEQ